MEKIYFITYKQYNNFEQEKRELTSCELLRYLSVANSRKELDNFISCEVSTCTLKKTTNKNDVEFLSREEIQS